MQNWKIRIQICLHNSHGRIASAQLSKVIPSNPKSFQVIPKVWDDVNTMFIIHLTLSQQRCCNAFSSPCHWVANWSRQNFHFQQTNKVDKTNWNWDIFMASLQEFQPKVPKSKLRRRFEIFLFQQTRENGWQ